MNVKQTRQEIQKEISQASAQIAVLTKRSTTLQRQSELLADRISELEQEIKARDWTLTGHRPKGSSETTKEATETRSRLYSERNDAARKLSELQIQLTPLSRELAEMRCNLASLEQEAITPESIQVEIEEASTRLAELQSEREALVSILADAETQLNEIDKSEDLKSEAAEHLTNVRASAYLAKPAESAALNRAIGEAEKRLERCRDGALNARAARPIVVANIEKAKKELRSINEEIEQQQVQLEKKQSQRGKIVAFARWANLMTLTRTAVRGILDVDRAVGRSLVEALMHEGLKEFNDQGRLVRPNWLKTGASGLENI
jgi:chromosome segregation ATPase